jgi:hypothetical protein
MPTAPVLTSAAAIRGRLVDTLRRDSGLALMMLTFPTSG